MSDTTYVEARYVIPEKLEKLLKELFGSTSNYSLETQGDNMEITAPRALTEAEINTFMRTQ
ncbi:hypothetical protein GQ53DRAFT_750950 [Thozetella sp. PMI_491]|nr:hypothetical protein GQ53DRAFT_750950 [Thozetella sp. PMI_491]